MAGHTIRPGSEVDRPEILRLLETWNGPLIVEAGRHYYADRLPSFIAESESGIAGLVTYSVEPPECVVVTLEALEKHGGIGTALLKAVESVARDAGCRRMWLTTTNDNVDALRFYQRRGWVLSALHRNSMDEVRRHKSLPATGMYGIPLRDELELEFHLD